MKGFIESGRHEKTRDDHTIDRTENKRGRGKNGHQLDECDAR